MDRRPMRASPQVTKHSFLWQRATEPVKREGPETDRPQEARGAYPAHQPSGKTNAYVQTKSSEPKNG